MQKILISLALILMSQSIFAISYTLEISSDELQKRVTSMQPIRFEKAYGSVHFVDPKVNLLNATNEIKLTTPMQINLLGRKLPTGKATIRGKLRYEPAKGEFYLDAPQVEEFYLEGMSESHKDQVKELTQVTAEKILATKTLYAFDASMTQKMAKAAIKSVTVKDSKLLITLGY